MNNHVIVEMEMMRDPNCGIGQFCLQLSSHLKTLDHDKRIKILAPSTAMESVGNDRLMPIEKYFRMKCFSFFQEQAYLWHITNQNSKFMPASRRSKMLLTIHDVNFLHELTSNIKKESFLSDLRRKIDRSVAIAVDSEYISHELKSRFSIVGLPVHVIPLSANDGQNISLSRPKVIPREDFLFAIGYVHPKKNFHVLVDMLERLPKMSLVIAGSDRKRYAFDIRSMIEKKKLQERAFLVGSISEAEKWWYYRNCKAFVFPSLLEGFGIPVLEAMHCGKPVFISDKTSLPEVGGKEAFYWNKFDPDYMAEIFNKGMAEYDHEKSRQIKKWAAQFNWLTTAEKYLKLYDSI